VVRRVVVFTFLAALAVFCVVQDRVTAAGAQQYALRALAAIDRHQSVPPIDAVMRPAVRRSVKLGFLSADAVLTVGIVTAVVVSRRRRG
jgi:ABC-type Fe3+ transport system permease subunit